MDPIKSLSDCLLVSFDFSPDDKSICVVGRQKNKAVDVINYFEGEKARNIYNLLTTINKKED